VPAIRDLTASSVQTVERPGGFIAESVEVSLCGMVTSQCVGQNAADPQL